MLHCNFEVTASPKETGVGLRWKRDNVGALEVIFGYKKIPTYNERTHKKLIFFFIMSPNSTKTAAVHRRCRIRGPSKIASFLHSHAFELTTACFDIHELSILCITLNEQSGFRIEHLRPATNSANTMSVTIGFVSCHDQHLLSRPLIKQLSPCTVGRLLQGDFYYSAEG